MEADNSPSSLLVARFTDSSLLISPKTSGKERLPRSLPSLPASWFSCKCTLLRLGSVYRLSGSRWNSCRRGRALWAPYTDIRDAWCICVLVFCLTLFIILGECPCVATGIYNTIITYIQNVCYIVIRKYFIIYTQRWDFCKEYHATSLKYEWLTYPS
jgi:hypothetical protein